MAEPIHEVAPPEDEAALLAEWQALWSVPGRAEAVAETLDLLRALHERGLLDAGRALLTDDATATAALVEFLRQSRNLRVARNVRALWEILASVDLDRVVAPPGAGPTRRTPPRPMGLLELRRRLRDPDVSAGVAVVLEALAAVGRSTRAGGAGRPP
jgi:uncharacterized protein YjgD (DUF1641 family)